ncbi:MAG: hypothetical protein ACFFFK_05805, partial [Candidatus Thorarchaeota archaeon]
MRKEAAILVLVVIIGAAVFILLQQDNLIQDSFDTEGRYDASVLNDMGVIYVNRSDIRSFNEA